MVKKITVKKILTDEEIKDMEGSWIEEKHIDKIVKEDSDIYLEENGKKKLIAKFRKKILSEELTDLAFDCFKNAAKPSRGRGASAGPINPDNQYWKKRIPVNTNKWSTQYIVNGDVSKMKVNNQVASNVIGYYEATPFLKLPARMTNYTRSHFDKFQKGMPFLQKLSALYKNLVPTVHNRQLRRASKRSYLKIPNTAFSSITVNRNFRTALHVDEGNYKDGMAVQTVIERGKYRGGYTAFPQYGVGIDVRHGDVLVMDNCHSWHSNTPVYETKSDKKYNESLEDIFKDNAEVGTAGLDKKYTRLTFVCYLREKLLESPESSGGNKYILPFYKKKNTIYKRRKYKPGRKTIKKK